MDDTITTPAVRATSAVRATIPCAWCGQRIQWDRIGRVEYDDGLNEDVCALCLHRRDTG